MEQKFCINCKHCIQVSVATFRYSFFGKELNTGPFAGYNCGNPRYVTNLVTGEKRELSCHFARDFKYCGPDGKGYLRGTPEVVHTREHGE